MIKHRHALTRKMSARLPIVAAALALPAGLAAAGPTETTLQPRMGDPIPGLTAEEMDLFLIGQMRYQEQLLEEDGLGPIFNKESCGNCHSNPVGGAGTQTVAVTVCGR